MRQSHSYSVFGTVRHGSFGMFDGTEPWPIQDKWAVPQMRFTLRYRNTLLCSHGQTQFETLCADAYLNPELNQIMIKAAGSGEWMRMEANKINCIIHEVVIGNGYVSKLDTAQLYISCMLNPWGQSFSPYPKWFNYVIIFNYGGYTPSPNGCFCCFPSKVFIQMLETTVTHIITHFVQQMRTNFYYWIIKQLVHHFVY